MNLIEKCTPHSTQKHPLETGKCPYSENKVKKDEAERESYSQKTHMENKPHLIEYRVKNYILNELRIGKVVSSILLPFGYFY